MNFHKGVSFAACVLIALAVVPSIAFAQPGSFGGGFGPPLSVVNPPRTFATSDEHYAFLLEQAKGGTKHTLASVPRVKGKAWLRNFEMQDSSNFKIPLLSGDRRSMRLFLARMRLLQDQLRELLLRAQPQPDRHGPCFLRRPREWPPARQARCPAEYDRWNL